MTTLVHGSIKSTSKKIAIIMAGGSGTRFWPLSRSNFPKQYLNFGDKGLSLIQDTYNRVKDLVDDVLVVTSVSQIELVKQHLPNVCILAEPCAKNTAGCVAYATKFIEKICNNPTVIFLPADHKIKGHEEFNQVFGSAISLAEENEVLVTIGIVPTRPETGYGYIKKGADFKGFYKVESFVEKPNLETAKKYLLSNHYFWNSGIFAWKISTIQDSLSKFVPEIYKTVSEIFSAGIDLELDTANKAFAKMPSVSVDTAVMEKADNVVVVPGEGFYWSDIGSWESWMETLELEGASLSQGDVINIDSKGCGIFGKNRLIAAIGLEDLVIVDTDDALLICKKDRSQDVRKIVEKLKEKGRGGSIT